MVYYRYINFDCDICSGLKKSESTQGIGDNEVEQDDSNTAFRNNEKYLTDTVQ